MLKGYYMNYWKGRQKEKRDRTKNEKMMDDDDDDDDDDDSFTLLHPSLGCFKNF
jgi:hypothetical protein